MKQGSLFAGIGGFELGGKWAGVPTAWSNDINKDCCRVLRKNFNHEVIEAPIQECGQGRKHPLQWVDLICGGFPCQPFSQGGKRRGENDPRFLWEENIRLIREIKPPCVIGENVSGILTMDKGRTFEKICLSLEDSGYSVQPFNIPIGAVGGWDQRERIWILAYSHQNANLAKNEGRFGKEIEIPQIDREKWNSPGFPSRANDLDILNAERAQSLRRGIARASKEHESFTLPGWGKTIRTIREVFSRADIPKPVLLRDDDGLPPRMDRIEMIGNTISPYIAYILISLMKEYHLQNLQLLFEQE